MYPSLISFILGLILISKASSSFALLFSGVLIALGYGTIYTCIQTIAIKVSPKHRIALATSTFFIFIDGGIGVGPLIIGNIIPILGFRGMYISLAAIVFLSIFLYYFVHGKKSASAKHSSIENKEIEPELDTIMN